MQKNAIITGGVGALGTAIVNKLNSINYRITATLGPGDQAESDAGSNLIYQKVNLTGEEETNDFVKDYFSREPKVDLLVLTVGGFSAGSLEDTTVTDINRMINLNFHTAFNLVKPVVKKMRAQETGGQIIFIGSRPAINPQEGKNTLAYSLSKSLLFSFAEILNAQYQRQNIDTSVIVPSIIDTPANRKAMPDANFPDWVKPEEIAEAVEFIISGSGQKLRNTNFYIYGNV